tara:strand:+ start:192 stop:383 length:192 start_codon:yes stop_codon:yes gene_type:complete
LKNSWVKYSNAGFQVIATLILFGWIGYEIDSSYPTQSPLLLVLSLFLGVFIALYQLWSSFFRK